jgi:hypothetical protein
MAGATSYVLVRGLLFALLACSLLIDPVAAPAAFRDDDSSPRDPTVPVWEDAWEDAGEGAGAADEAPAAAPDRPAPRAAAD